MSDPAESFHESPPDGFPINPTEYECPKCGRTIEVVLGPVAHLVLCPTCHESLLIPSETGSTHLPEEDDGASERAAAATEKEGELDSLRMRNLVVLRRSAMRSRGYAIIGACVCLTAGVKLVLMTIEEVRVVGWRFREVLLALFAVAALWGIPYFLRRAAYWARESKSAILADPTTPPDFSTLSDGSQHARNLDDIK